MAVIFDGNDAEVAPSAETSTTSLEDKKVRGATAHVEEKFLE